MSGFNQKKYEQNWHKEHYSTFKVDLKKDEKEELDDILKKQNLSKADFLRKSINNLKEELKMKEEIIKKMEEKGYKKVEYTDLLLSFREEKDLTNNPYDYEDDLRKAFDNGNIELIDNIQYNFTSAFNSVDCCEVSIFNSKDDVEEELYFLSK